MKILWRLRFILAKLPSQLRFLWRQSGDSYAARNNPPKKEWLGNTKPPLL